MSREQSLRIAIVAQDFHREGGSEGRTGQLVDRLVAQGHEVHLVGARIRGAWSAGVVLHPVRTPKHPHWLDALLFSRRARLLAAAGAFDLVHNQLRPYVPGIVTVGGGCHHYYLHEVLPAERGPLAARLRALTPLQRVLLAMERRGFRPEACPYVIANSQLGRAGILKYSSLAPDRVVVAYNGVDGRRFSPAARALYRDARRAALGVAPGEMLLLFVGKGFARKGLGVLLAAIGRLASARPGTLRLAVVGQGATRRWEAQARALGIADRVRFVGHACDPEAYYAAADVFVLPTFFDPFANATLEAMASGLPVITSRLNGASEVLTPGSDGLVIEDPRDVTSLADAIAEVANPGRREAMGQRARETALRYAWDGPLRTTLDVYERTLALRA